MEKKKTISRFISIFINVLIVLTLLILLMNIFLNFRENKKDGRLPGIFGYKFLIELSDSMYPVLKVDDLVIIKENKSDSYKKGDIISFRNKEQAVITHRIIKVITKDNKIYYQTKGDNNGTKDIELVENNQIEGIYVTSLRGVGGVYKFLASPSGITVILLVIVIIFLMDFLIQKYKAEE